MRSAVALAALLAGSALAQGSATLSWTPPTQNTDGTPAVLGGFKAYWGVAAGSYPNSAVVPGAGAATSFAVNGLTAGTWNFVVTAISSSGAESAFSNIASKVIPAAPVLAPNPPTAFSLTFKPTPVVAVTVSLSFDTLNPDVPTLTIVGAGPVTVTLDPPLNFDWIRSGAVDPNNGQGGTLVVTTPALGSGNNDGVFANAVTITGPVTARADIDTTPGANGPFTGASATVAGVTKRLVQAGNVWKVVFP